MGAKRESAVIPDGTPVRLTDGGHSSPREGVCVVELASLIAQEEFSDRPRCVCPVIGAFLRGWNDRAPYAERQRLSPYAERIVGSRGSPRVTRERRDICLRWAGAGLSYGAVSRLGSRAATRVRIAIFCGLGAAVRLTEGAGDYAARVAMAEGDADRAFELLDTLLAVDEERRPGPSPVSATGNGHAPLNGNGLPPRARNGLPAANGRGPIVNGGSHPVDAFEDELSESTNVSPTGQ
ncbi:MAG: hypothetical protein AABM42_00960 [Actinomycetota bacterium]